jgi:hypothetical protein
MTDDPELRDLMLTEQRDEPEYVPSVEEIWATAKAIRLARKDDRKGAMHDKHNGPVALGIRVCRYVGPKRKGLSN